MVPFCAIGGDFCRGGVEGSLGDLVARLLQGLVARPRAARRGLARRGLRQGTLLLGLVDHALRCRFGVDARLGAVALDVRVAVHHRADAQVVRGRHGGGGVDALGRASDDGVPVDLEFHVVVLLMERRHLGVVLVVADLRTLRGTALDAAHHWEQCSLLSEGLSHCRLLLVGGVGACRHDGRGRAGLLRL